MSRFKVRNLLKFRTKSTTDLSEWNKNDEKLLKMVESGDVKKTTSLLSKKTLNPTKLGPKGHSVFHIACAVGNEQIVDILLKYSEDVNDLTIQGNTALQLAAAKGFTAVVYKLLQVSADVDMRDSNDMTALHHACGGNHCDCVQVLLNGGANPRTTDKTGKTPLFFASHRGDVSTCKWLVDKGANVNAQDMYNMTSLMVAAKGGHSEVCRFLLKKGANPDFVDRDGNNALAYAPNTENGEMKEVFAHAPTRASWDVHANNNVSAKTSSGATLTPAPDPEPEPQPEPVIPDQVDTVNKFVSAESPAVHHRDIHTDVFPRRELATDYDSDGDMMKDRLQKSQSEAWDRRQQADQKTTQALRELEEEHEQLNEDYRNLTLENRKLFEKIDSLKHSLGLAKQGQAEIPQAVEDEVNNLRNLLDKEVERSRDLEEQNERLTSQTQDLATENQSLLENQKHHDDLQTQIEADRTEEKPEDSWGDSDEELFDSPTGRRKNKSSPDDRQMLVLLRSQILTLRQENDQLKDKMQLLRNGFRGASPYMFSADASQSGDVHPETSGTSGTGGTTEQVEALQQAVVQLEVEKEDMQKEILQLKEKTEVELLNGAISHEELVAENKRLSDELDTMQRTAAQSPEHGHSVNCHEEAGQSGEEEGRPREEELRPIEEEGEDNGGESEKKKKKKPELSEEDHSRMEFLELQNQELRDQCERLSGDLDELRITFNAILKAGDNLQAEFDQLINDKEQVQEELERVGQDKEELEKENEFLLTDGNALHEDLKKLVHELEKMQEKYKDVLKEKEELERKTSAIALSGKVGEFTKLLEEQDKLKARNEELEATSSRLQHDQEILLEEVQSMQEQMKVMDTEREQLQAETEEIEGVLQQHDVLQQDYTQLEQDYAELLKDKEKLEQELLDRGTVEVESESWTPEEQAEVTKENQKLVLQKEELQRTVSDLFKANTDLQADMKTVSAELEQSRKRLEAKTSSLTNGEVEGKKDVKAQSDSKPERSLKIKSLQTQILHLQQQLADFDRQHQDIVNVYRTHLISAVQGHMDPDVKQALHHIIELRSMEQFC